MQIEFKAFDELTSQEVYDMMKLRFDVFVLEQKCLYPEFDDIDAKAVHVLIKDEEELAASARLYKKTDKRASFGRVVVDEVYRGRTIGKELVRESINYIHANWDVREIEIGAQTQLNAFYTSFGFEDIGDEYDDAGIMHVDMLLTL
jgi:ElaA protein